MDSDIIERLDTLIRIQALLAVRTMETQKDKILFLSGAGVRPKDIATILGTTANSVSVAIAKSKKTSSATPVGI